MKLRAVTQVQSSVNILLQAAALQQRHYLAGESLVAIRYLVPQNCSKGGKTAAPYDLVSPYMPKTKPSDYVKAAMLKLAFAGALCL